MALSLTTHVQRRQHQLHLFCRLWLLHMSAGAIYIDGNLLIVPSIIGQEDRPTTILSVQVIQSQGWQE